MNLTSSVFSPAGTPLQDQTVGEIVARQPWQGTIFDRRGMGYCCHGDMTVREACEARGQDLAEVLEELQNNEGPHPAVVTNPAELPLDAMVAHIIATHHQRLRDELPKLSVLAAAVADAHGEAHPELYELQDLLERFDSETFCHISKEEEMVFPAIVALASGDKKAVELDSPIAMMMREHNDTGEDLEELRELTNDYEIPGDACGSYRALMEGLTAMEADMFRHIHLENSVLFPSALAMAAEGAGE